MAGSAWRGGPGQRKPPERVHSGVAFLARIVRFLLWLIFLSWATWLARKLFVALWKAPARRVSYPAPPASKPLYRDPWCGTHVSAEISYTLEQAGQVLHFCSAECRDRYRASQQRAAGE